MNLKSRFVVPIRSRYAFVTNHFELEIVSGNEGIYFVSRYRGRGIPKKSEFFFLLKAIRPQKATGENIWVIDSLHSLKLKVVWTEVISEAQRSRIFLTVPNDLFHMKAAKSQANHLTRVHRANTVVIKYHCDHDRERCYAVSNISWKTHGDKTI